MEQRVFHGNILPQDLALPLITEFNRGNLKAQSIGDENQILVQIATHEQPQSGGQTALTITLRKVEDGVAVQIGKQNWLGIAASLGKSTLIAWKNPWRLIERLDDIIQDIEYLNLAERVWEVIEQTARSIGATFELSERLKRLVCDYCRTANPVGEPHCVACGAPLGNQQPVTCPKCGFILAPGALTCSNCGYKIG